jgi:hypothetical protein
MVENHVVVLLLKRVAASGQHHGAFMAFQRMLMRESGPSSSGETGAGTIGYIRRRVGIRVLMDNRTAASAEGSRWRRVIGEPYRVVAGVLLAPAMFNGDTSMALFAGVGARQPLF